MKLALKLALPLVALFVSAVASASNDYSLTINGNGSPVTFPIFSFSVGVSNNTTISSTGLKLGKGTVSPFSIFKQIDGNTGSLEAACFAGTQFNSVELVGTDHLTNALTLDIVLSHVIISSDQLAGSVGGDNGEESVSFNAMKMTINGVQVNVTTIAGIQKANKMIAEILHNAKSKTVLK